jgi:hypothetical protein
LGQRVRGLGPARPTFQRLALLNPQAQRCYRVSPSASRPSSYRKNAGGLQFIQRIYDSGH